MAKYVSALKREIRSSAGKFSEAVADTLYFGGGTPSLVGAERIAEIIKTVKDCFPAAFGEVSMECNPQPDIDYAAYRDAGVDRLSMGVQSLDDETLRLSGRRHSASEAAEALERAGRVFGNISADVMLGLPAQSVRSAVETVSRLAERLKHVSMYMLKLEKGTALYKSVSEKTVSLPSEDETVDMYDACMAELHKKGIYRYEISNFAVKGFESRHNLKYWHREEYLGFGAAAHGFADNIRYANPRSLNAYIAGLNFASGGAESYAVSSEDAEEEAVMLALRTDKGLDVERFNAEFGSDFFSRFSDAIEKCRELTEFDGSFFRIKPRKLLFESYVAREFMR